jgi:phage-related tail fiber protein
LDGKQASGSYAASSHVHAAATTTVAGFLSTTDKTKLDGIAAGANNYVHPNSGVTAGTYSVVTVNDAGHVTSGANATAIDFEITDATKGIILKSPDNSRFRISVDNDGILTTVKI